MALSAKHKPVYAPLPKTSVGVLNAASAGALNSLTNAVTVLTAGTGGCMVDALTAVSNDTAAVNLFVFIVGSDGVTVKPLFQVNVPINSGNGANILNVDVLNSSVSVGTLIDNTVKRLVRLGPSESLRISTLANMTAAKICAVTAQYQDIDVS